MEVGLNFINEDNPAMASNTLVLPLPFLPVNIRCFILSLDNGMRISSKCRTFSIVKAEINNWFTVPSLKYQCTPGIAWCSGLRDDFCQPFHPSYHKKTSQGIPWKVLSCHILSWNVINAWRTVVHDVQPLSRTEILWLPFSLDIPGFSGFLLLSYPVCGP